MKKMLKTLAVLSLISGAAFAQSTNCSVELPPGYSIVHTPFLNGTNAIDIQGIMDVSNLKKGTSIGAADALYFWDPITRKYKHYSLHDGSGKNNAAKAGKWVEYPSTVIASNIVPPGTAFYVYNSRTSTVTSVMSGDIVNSGTGSLHIVEGFNLVACPFTSDWELNAWPTNWIELGAVAGAGPASADQILLRDPVGDKFDVYYLHDGTGKNNAAKRGKWVRASDRSIADVTIGISQGFFFSRTPGRGTLNLNLKQPYTLE